MTNRMTKIEAIKYGMRWKNAICDRGDTENSVAVQFLNMAIEALEQEPSRATGEWIRNDNDTYSCNLCQSWIPEEQYHYARFCLHCGVRMESDEE